MLGCYEGARYHKGLLGRLTGRSTRRRHIKASTVWWMQFTSTYSSPERSNNADQRKVDVWAAGCILHELCTGTCFMRPRRGASIYTLMAELHDPNWSAPENALPQCMACWRPLLTAMLCRDPAQRPLPRELLQFDVLRCTLSTIPDPISSI
jgi:serine/threonine protein kinase